MNKFLKSSRYVLFAFAFVPVLAWAAVESPLNPAFSTVPGFVEGVLRAIVQIALPIIAFFIVYAGFLYVKARGNSEGISHAHKNFQYVILGAALILGAWVLATLIGGTISSLMS